MEAEATVDGSKFLDEVVERKNERRKALELA